ncbi:MAG: glycosyltransferase family 4 protein [Parcubacteria group bacterium]|nr:glycosyltransferase family 4 protein [Parcubacteria group bacterium]
MSKKIGIDIRCLLDENRSGVGEYTFNLLDTLFRTDRENEYFLFFNSWKKPTLPKWNYPNVHFCEFKFPNKLFNMSLKFFKYPKIDKLIADDIDVFLAPNLNFLSLSKDVKKIIIVHDLSFEIYPDFFSLKSRLWHKLINLKKICQEADVVIAVSKNTAQDLNDIYNIPRDKIKVVYSGVETKQCLVSTERIKQKYNLPENFILYLGNVEPRKNIDGLITAFEGLKNYHLVIAGSSGFKSRHLCNDHHKKNIKFLSYVPEEDRATLYKLAKLFVFPSYYEGFGFPPLEAMTQGTPVVSSISSSLIEVVGDAGILIDPYNTNELAWAMNEILTNKKMRDELIQRGYERVKMFKWKNTAEEVLKIINYSEAQ